MTTRPYSVDDALTYMTRIGQPMTRQNLMAIRARRNVGRRKRGSRLGVWTFSGDEIVALRPGPVGRPRKRVR